MERALCIAWSTRCGKPELSIGRDRRSSSCHSIFSAAFWIATDPGTSGASLARVLVSLRCLTRHPGDDLQGPAGSSVEWTLGCGVGLA
jgi:hypothetical protein